VEQGGFCDERKGDRYFIFFYFSQSPQGHSGNGKGRQIILPLANNFLYPFQLKAVLGNKSN